MSTLDESGAGVYYTPVGFPNQHPDNQEIQQHPYPQNVLKQCSVKGCADTLSSNDPNRMCEGCRSRHRIYAITKRARRKLEKAAITNAVAATQSGKDIQEMSIMEHVAQPVTWIAAGDRNLQPSSSTPSLALSSLSTWNHAIDPRLFSGDPPSAPAHHLSSPGPHQTSTTSELANALTPRLPSTPGLPAVLPNQIATDYSEHYPDPPVTQQQSSLPQVQALPQPHTSDVSRHDDDDSNDNDEEQQVIASLQDQPMQELNNLSPSDRQMSSETAEFVQGKSSDEVDGSTRFCSVKGCKAVIQASYEYKMCPPCRTRYRTYGNTKRAKWKAERDAFDREMASLRTVEDENRKAKGLKPLAESPEELRAWELSIIDEQKSLVSADNSTALPGASSLTAEPGLAQSSSPKATLPSTNSLMVLSGVYPPSASPSSTIDSPHAISPYPHLNKNPLLAAAANTSLPARMCTVSHCHKILPGYYRYKRCEQHRLQNRHHSQLKRVREKEVKAVGPKEVVETPAEMEADGRAEKDKDKDKDKKTKQVKALTTHTIGEGTSLPDIMTGGVHDGDSESKKEKSHDQKRSKFSCSAGDCHNLLLPTVRWRSCESCRSIDRQRKNQIKLEQKVGTDNYYQSEKMNGVPQPADVSENKRANGGNGKAQESQQTNDSVSAGANDHDAEGDICMGENVDKTKPKAVGNHQSPVAPTAEPLPSMPPLRPTSGFSRFHVTIDPRNASSSAALDPTTSTSKLVTLDDPLAFRTYRPKTTPSAIGRILARNPGLSVDAFTEVLQAEGAITSVMTRPLKEANGTSTTKPIITPTIPTSAPFVYKAPEKKIVPMKEQGGTTRKGKRKAASPEKESSVSTTPTPSAPASGASGLVASGPPGSYGTYGYPQYPCPYPYYMPPPYGMPPYPYPPAPPAPIPSDSKAKKSSKSSISPAVHVPPATAMLGYTPYPYPYPPQPYGYLPPPGGYPYLPTRYIPGQPGPSGSNPYAYPYYPPVSAPPAPIQAPAPASVSLPKSATTIRGRQQTTQNTKFTYYHYGVGNSDSPTLPNDKKGKRRKVDPDCVETFKAQTEVISMSLDMDQAGQDISGSVPTPPPPASVPSDSPNVPPPVVSTQPKPAVDAGVISKPITPTRPCGNKTCHRSLPVDTANTWCDKCRLRFKKCQAKTKKRFKLEPRKFLLTDKAVSEKQGLVDERKESKGSVELD